MPPETIFASQVQFLQEHSFKPLEQVTLEPYERDHAMVTGLSSFYCSLFKFTLLIFFLFQRDITDTASLRNIYLGFGKRR